MAASPRLRLRRPAPDFELPRPTAPAGRSDVRGPKGALIVFICNHCPYVKAVADKLAFEAASSRPSASAWRRSVRTTRWPIPRTRPTDAPLRRAARLHVPLPARRRPVGGAGLRRGLHAGLLRLQRALALQYRGRLDASGPRAMPDAERELYARDEAHRGDRQGARAPDAIDRLLDQVHRLLHQVARPCLACGCSGGTAVRRRRD
jgi:hypothetical protein